MINLIINWDINVMNYYPNIKIIINVMNYYLKYKNGYKLKYKSRIILYFTTIIN